MAGWDVQQGPGPGYSTFTSTMPRGGPMPGLQAVNPFGGINQGLLQQMLQTKTLPQQMGEINSAENMIPQTVSAAAIPQFNPQAGINYYQRMVVAPQVAQIKADLASEGRDNSSFGGAQLGEAQALGNLNAWQAGQDYMNNAAQRWAQERGAYFGAYNPQLQSGPSGNDFAQYLLGSGGLGLNYLQNAENQYWQGRQANGGQGGGFGGGTLAGFANGASAPVFSMG